MGLVSGTSHAPIGGGGFESLSCLSIRAVSWLFLGDMCVVVWFVSLSEDAVSCDLRLWCLCRLRLFLSSSCDRCSMAIKLGSLSG